MRLLNGIIALAGLCVFGTVCAADNEALFAKYDCHICHQSTGKRMVGPSFAMIAERYAGDATAVAQLTKKVRLGGPGSWGAMPMPPVPANATDAEIKAMVTQILATK